MSGEHIPQYHLNRIHRGLERQKHQSKIQHGDVLGPLHVCNIWIVWCSCGDPISDSGSVSDFFASSWDPFPLTGLPCRAKVWEFMPSLSTFCYALFDWYPWETWNFLNGTWATMYHKETRFADGDLRRVGWERAIIGTYSMR